MRKLLLSLRQSAAVGLAAAGLAILWQCTAWAVGCPTNNNCPDPSDCNVNISAAYSCCSTDGVNCCQYACRTFTYSGSNCPYNGQSCVATALLGEKTKSTCQGNGNCTI